MSLGIHFQIDLRVPIYFKLLNTIITYFSYFETKIRFWFLLMMEMLPRKCLSYKLLLFTYVSHTSTTVKTNMRGRCTVYKTPHILYTPCLSVVKL